jgi:hypothetical protein
VRAGGVVVAADVDFNELYAHRDEYIAASDFFRARANYGAETASSESFRPSPVYGLDRRTQRREFDVSPATMVVSEWLRPVYTDVERILAMSPVDLQGWQDVLASGDRSHTATLQHDEFVNEFDHCTFATVRQLGDGYVVLIAANVSHDVIVDLAPDNPRWILNTIRFLRGEIAKDSRRYAGIRQLQKLFEEVKGKPEGGDPDTKLNQAFDREAQTALRREHAEGARQALSEMFGPLWETTSEEARRQLVAAEVYRHDAELLADTETWLDFSAAVGAYSRAVEIELLRRLFEPYRDWPDAEQLPKPRSEKRDGESLRALSRHLNGHILNLGQMGFILMHVGCRLRHEEPNAFAAYLRQRLSDHDAFCDDVRFPQRLIDYAAQFRNRAMHVDELTADDCKAARDYLFEEPVRLLVYLGEVLQNTA